MREPAPAVWIYRQKASTLRCPGRARLTAWAAAALHVAAFKPSCALTVRLVDAEEAQTLNAQYRHKNYPTNVLSFPNDAPPNPDDTESSSQETYLGDLVICMPVLLREALAQHKSLQAHTAHLVIHGVLHLLGYDHEMAEQADAMESREILALQHLGFSNPYVENQSIQ